MKRILFLLFLLLSSSCVDRDRKPALRPQTGRVFAPSHRTVRVLDLFHPREAVLRIRRPQGCRFRCGGATIPASERTMIRMGGEGVELEMEGRSHAGSRVTALAADGTEWSGEFELLLSAGFRRSYRGGISVWSEEKSLVFALRIEREELVLGVLRGEASAEDPGEYLAALAVAGRSYVSAAARRHGEIDFCDNTHCQVFVGLDREDPRFASAAAKSAGMVLTYEEKLVPAHFCAVCGGSTLTARSVWEGENSGYPFPAVDCVACSVSPRYRWERTIDGNEFARIFGTAFASTARIRLDSARGEDLRCVQMESGGRTYRRSVDDFRLQVGRVLGWNKILSNQFSLSRTNDKLIVRGRGFGHGVGLCQEGAKRRAREGNTWREILARYYPGTTIEHLNQNAGPQ